MGNSNKKLSRPYATSAGRQHSGAKNFKEPSSHDDAVRKQSNLALSGAVRSTGWPRSPRATYFPRIGDKNCKRKLARPRPVLLSPNTRVAECRLGWAPRSKTKQRGR